jgi:hypothetical protein
LLAKKKSWKEFGDFMIKNSKHNRKLFCRALKNFRKERECPLKYIKWKKRKLLTSNIEIMNRWREYFLETEQKEGTGLVALQVEG